MDDQYIVLPSNVYATNTPADFTTTFEIPIQLDNVNEWEVALVEMNFKNSIKTIVDDNAEVFTNYTNRKSNETDQTLNESKVEYFTFDYNATPLHSKSTRFLINIRKMIKLSNLSSLSTDNFQFYYVPETGYMYYKNISKFETIVTFPEIQMLSQLGFINKKFNFTFNRIKSQGIVRANTKPQIITTTKGISYIILESIIVKKKDIASSSLKFVDSISMKETDFQRQEDNFDDSNIEVKTYKMYPHVMNINMKMIKYNITFIPYDEVKRKVILKIKSGTYTDAKDLETELNKDVEFIKFFKFSFDERLNRFDLITITEDKTATLHLKNGLHDVLGFTEKVLKTSTENQKGDLEVNLLRGISSLFVYCDILETIRVGNTMSPLLRAVAYNTRKYGEMVHVNYNNPIYLKVNKTFIDTITIKICDSTGELIPFIEGLTTMLLHLKRI